MMFRLPVCPHCGTVYHYKDVRKIIKKKEDTCYHCKKGFKASLFPGVLVGGGILLALNVLLNVLLLFRMEKLQLWPLFLSTLVFILLMYIIIPFFTSFIKTEKIEIKNKGNKSDKKKKR